jgi:pseudouridine kinase
MRKWWLAPRRILPISLLERWPTEDRIIARIACFGAAHVDHRARALGPVRLGTSNPVAMRHGPGGVARNVAESLTRLGCDVALVTRLGNDPAGDRVLAALAVLGTDLSQVSRSATAETAGYTALIEPTGEMAIALADMAIYEELTPAVVGPAASALTGRTIWFLDANLPAATLEHLLAHKPAGTIAAVDAVSVAKAERLRGLLARIDLLIVNRDEATFLSGRAIRAPLDVCEAAHRLRVAGVGAVIVNLGGQGAFAADDQLFDFFAPLKTAVVDVTGAGDGMAAGVVYGLSAGRALAEAMVLGQANAALAVESAEAVPPTLSLDQLLARGGLSL